MIKSKLIFSIITAVICCFVYNLINSPGSEAVNKNFIDRYNMNVVADQRMQIQSDNFILHETKQINNKFINSSLNTKIIVYAYDNDIDTVVIKSKNLDELYFCSFIAFKTITNICDESVYQNIYYNENKINKLNNYNIYVLLTAAESRVVISKN